MAALYKNPFTPTFGSIPLQLAGRDGVIHDILDGLDNAPGSMCKTGYEPNKSFIIGV